MKIEILKTMNTVEPERHWTEGEIVEIEIKKGRKLLTNPNFREVKEVKKQIRKPKRRYIKNKI